MRAVNNHGSASANANTAVEPARASMPATRGSRRPTRSDTTPIGTPTATSVTPNDANSSPIIVALAPRRRAKSGSTGTHTEYATRSVNVASVTSATATPREYRNDMAVRDDSSSRSDEDHE